jgi:DNA-binding NarL/FixJ family response regulator
MGDRPRVLLVDDTDLKSLQLVIDTDAVDIVAMAENGEEALATTANTNFDVAVVDYKMPGMNGLEVAKRLKEMKPDVKVIILTSYDVRDEVSQSPAVDHYHEKIAVDSITDKILELSGKAPPEPAGAHKKKGLFGRKG